MSWFSKIMAMAQDARGVSPLIVEPPYDALWEREPDSKSTKQWGLSQVHIEIHQGERSVKVRDFQYKLEALGYKLPRFGADGVLGDETLCAVADFQDDCESEGNLLKTREHALRLRGVGKETYDTIMIMRVSPIKETPEDSKVGGAFVRLVDEDAPGKRAKRERPWAQIRGVTLHQTATLLGEDPKRYRNVATHIAVTRGGQIVLINGLNQIVYHGNAFNTHDVGIEIDGHFEGVEGNIRTYWRPKSKPNRKPLQPTGVQIAAARQALRWVADIVRTHGGNLEWIHAHRQSSKMRTSDPGSRIWKDVGIWAKTNLGLKDGGPEFTAGGYPIPKQWDPSYTTRYRPW